MVEAVDGQDAYAKVMSESPDLVLSDWNMPNMTGIEFLRTLRSAGSAVPFAFVTSEGGDDMRALAMSSGALGLITKPFTPDSFGEVLDLVPR